MRQFYHSQDGLQRSPQLAGLLSAIQTRNLPSVRSSFIEWTNALRLDTETYDDLVLEELLQLPRTTVSEIIRNLDPIAHPELDLAHGLRLAQGQAQYQDLEDLADEFGVRPHHRSVLRGMQTLAEAIGGPAENGLLVSDLETMMRCAGATHSSKAAINFFGLAGRLQGYAGRTSRTILEFIKARFFTEPVYQQHDPSRTVLRARDIVANNRNVSVQQIRDMDKMRFSLNALMREPWNREEDNLARRKQRSLRDRSRSPTAFRMHWARLRGDGADINEEVLCASMLGFSRSSSLREILIKIFEMRYGIRITYQGQELRDNTGARYRAANSSDFAIKGGYGFPQGHPFEPSPRLLYATIDAFGSMGHITLGLKLLDHLSQTYQIPLTHEMWSRLLNWLYIHASSPMSAMRDSLGPVHQNNKVVSEHIKEIVSIMTSEPFNLTLSFDDNVILAKTLIADCELDEALDILKTRLVPKYETLVQDHQREVTEEVMRADTAPFHYLTNNDRRQRAEILLDNAWHHIRHLVDRLMTKAGTYKPFSADSERQGFIPDLVRDFGIFLDKRVMYRTSQGIVELWRPHPDVPFSRAFFEMRDRFMLPAKQAGWITKSKEKYLQSLVDEDETQPSSVTQTALDAPAPTVGSADLTNAASTPEATSDDHGSWWPDFHKSPEEPRTPPPVDGAWWSDFELPTTERRLVKQFTRVPLPRERDLRMPMQGADDAMLKEWRGKVARELLL